MLLRLFFKMTYYVLSGMLNSVHSMAVFWFFSVFEFCTYLLVDVNC